MARLNLGGGCALLSVLAGLSAVATIVGVGVFLFRVTTRGPVTAEEAAWFTAARKGDVPALEQALARGVDVNAAERHHGRTALMRAAFFGHRPAVEALVARRARVDAVDFETATALHLAASAGEADVVRALAQAGADVDRRQDPDGRTPLFAAVEAGQAAAAQALLESGADPSRGNQNESPLERAIDDARPDLVTLLLSRGAKPVPSGGQLGRDGLLLRAVDQCQDADPAILSALVRAGADPAATDAQGRTAFYWARYFAGRADRRACSERQLAALTAAGVTR